MSEKLRSIREMLKKFKIKAEHASVLEESISQAMLPRVTLLSASLLVPDPSKPSASPNWRGFMSLSIRVQAGMFDCTLQGVKYSLLEESAGGHTVLSAYPDRGSAKRRKFNTELRGPGQGAISWLVAAAYPRLVKKSQEVGRNFCWDNFSDITAVMDESGQWMLTR